MTTQISAPVLNVLSNCSVEGDRLKLPPSQLERKLYQDVNEVLTRLGGKWKGGKVAAHVFPVCPQDLLDEVLATGQMPLKNPLSFFATPSPVALQMVATAQEHAQSIGWVQDEIRVLEPSAGDGAIVEAVLQQQLCLPENLTAIEIDNTRHGLLSTKFPGAQLGDFMILEDDTKYHFILMNPPFTIPSNKTVYVDHIRKAWEALEPKGLLLAIAPPGFTFSNISKLEKFRDFVDYYGSFTSLPPGTFKSSGTTVETVLIQVTK